MRFATLHPPTGPRCPQGSVPGRASKEMEIAMKRLAPICVTALVLSGFTGYAVAEEINCANKYRSGNLSFAQAQKSERERRKLMRDAVEQYRIAVNLCPEEGEYHMKYAMALAEHGVDLLNEGYIEAETAEQQESLLTQAMEAFTLVGVQFDSAQATSSKKKLLKDIRENREHYWVEHYNLGIKLMQDKEPNPRVANREFEIARLIDPTRPKAYHQGAIAMIQLEMKSEAAKLVQVGIEQAPEDKELNELLEKLYMDAARSLTLEAEEAEPAEARAKSEQAIEFLKSLEARRPDDAEVHFEKGSAHMAFGRAVKKMDKEGEGTPEAAKAFEDGAGAYEQAASLVDPATDRDFFLAAKMNRLLALLEKEDFGVVETAAREYLGYEALDPTVWQILAQNYAQQDNTESTFSALMVFKSLQGEEIEVSSAESNASGDAKSALDTMGKPAAVYGSQESESGNQIQTWFWPEQKTVVSYMLGVEQGRITW